MKSKIMMLVFVLALSGVAQAQYIVFEEDFESLKLGESPEEAPGTPDVWTDTPPPGWFVDDSGVPGAGDPANDGVTDWAGWAFADKDFWIATDGQDRDQFVLGQGTVAVCDGDEWDDSGHPAAEYNAYMSTPAIDLSASKPGTLNLRFDSSWRPYDTQTGQITAQYDGGQAIEILRWESQAGANFKDFTNETAFVNLANPAGAKSLILTFGYFDAGNDWWWAIDNIMMTAVARLDPSPPIGAEQVAVKTVLSWTPEDNVGALSPKHRVILSDSLDAVENGTAVVATQDANSYDATGLLDYSTTYYWRIDEASSTGGWDQGSVWSFTTEPVDIPIDGGSIIATASSQGQANVGPENTINASGLDPNDLHSTDDPDMWLSGTEPEGAWIQYEFDEAQKLHEMWVWNYNAESEALFGFGLRDVTIEYSQDGIAYTTLGTTHEFLQAPAPAGPYAHNTTVDFGSAVAKFVKLTANSNWTGAFGALPSYGLSEVRFFSIPVRAREPSPDSGAAGVDVDVVLGWRAGRDAVAHNVAFSDDEQAVIDGTATVVSVTNASYTSPLDLESTYYWRVDEVNEAETPTTWQGDVWDFATSDHIVVDDFESYNDNDDLADPASHRIFESWPDGYLTPTTNGALVGNALPPYAEVVTVHGGGGQAMPMFYSNTGGPTVSEATRTFADPQDWTAHGVTTLVLWFYGTPGNTGQMYVKINGSRIPYDGVGGTALEGWIPWIIDLTSSGVDVQSVGSLTIGVDGVGTGGTLYVDDIRLYASAPEPLNEWTITAGSDDAEEDVGGSASFQIDLTSTDLELMYDDNPADPLDEQVVGLRFVGLPIPKGATITEAWVRFDADDVDDSGHVGNAYILIDGELNPAPITFENTPNNITARPRTAAQVSWTSEPWPVAGGSHQKALTPDISSIIQEIVNQDGWAGSALVLIFSQDPATPSVGHRECESFTDNATSNIDRKPTLHISYE